LKDKKEMFKNYLKQYLKHQPSDKNDSFKQANGLTDNQLKSLLTRVDNIRMNMINVCFYFYSQHMLCNIHNLH